MMLRALEDLLPTCWASDRRLGPHEVDNSGWIRGRSKGLIAAAFNA